MGKAFKNNFTFKKPDGTYTAIEAKSEKEARDIFDKKYPTPKKVKEVSKSKLD